MGGVLSGCVGERRSHHVNCNECLRKDHLVRIALQLSEGLSSEYIKNRKTEDADVDEPTAKFDADRQVNSKYFVNQILQQGEEGLRDAWSKVSNTLNCLQIVLRLSLTRTQVVGLSWCKQQALVHVITVKVKPLTTLTYDLISKHYAGNICQAL